MDKNTLGIFTIVAGFIGIIATYIFNSIQDRNIQLFKTKQKYYNILLESLIIKLSEVELFKAIENNIENLKSQLIKSEISLLEEKDELSKIESGRSISFFPQEVKEKIENLELKKNELIERINFVNIEKEKRRKILLEANKVFSIEASRLPLYASEEIIDYIEKSKNSEIVLTLENFYSLMRSDLSSGKLKKIKKINFSGTLYK